MDATAGDETCGTRVSGSTVPISSIETKEGQDMKKMILIGALALLARLRKLDNSGSARHGGTRPVETLVRATLRPTISTSRIHDTISVNDFGDMPPECIALWRRSSSRSNRPSPRPTGRRRPESSKRTSEHFQTESDTFDAQSSAPGCNKYNLTGPTRSSSQCRARGQTDAPGTRPVSSTFLGTLTNVRPGTNSLPGLQPTVAAIEPYLPRAR